MGKTTLLLAFLGLLAAGSLVFQAQKDSLEARQRESEREREIRVRAIAQSGHNMVMSRALRLHGENPSLSLYEIVDLVNGENGTIHRPSQGGTFEARLVSTSISTIAAIAAGNYQDTTLWVSTPNAEGSVGGRTMPDLLQVSEPSELAVTLAASNSGYCSALYLQRILPDIPLEDQPEAELLFPPGNMRDGTSARFSGALQPGTRMNFVLAVDADYNCEKRNVPVPITHWTYEYVRPALAAELPHGDDLQEGKYALIQQSPNRPGVWRIAFEDLVFGDDKLRDVKANGYGSAAWSSGTYGGSGWSATDGQGYFQLEMNPHMPDYHDQVIEVELTPVEALARN